MEKSGMRVKMDLEGASGNGVYLRANFFLKERFFVLPSTGDAFWFGGMHDDFEEKFTEEELTLIDESVWMVDNKHWQKDDQGYYVVVYLIGNM